MKWFKAIGFGFALFAIMFVVGSIIMFGLNMSETASEIPMFIALIVVLWVLARQYKINSLNQGIQVGFIWLLVYALLDYIVIIRIFNPENTAYYTHWRLYLWYALIVIVPALVGQTIIKRTAKEAQL